MQLSAVRSGTPVYMRDGEHLGEVVGCDDDFIEVKSTAEGNRIHVEKRDIDLVEEDRVVLAVDMEAFVGHRKERHRS